MASSNSSLKLAHRIILLIVNFSIFYGVFFLINQSFLFTGGLESVWLLAALALWFYSLLSVPFFIPPRDGLVVAITSLTMLVTMDLQNAGPISVQLDYLRWIGVVVCGFVATAALVALISHSNKPNSPMTRFLFSLNNVLGSGEVLFTFPVLISVVGTYHSEPVILISLFLLWGFFATSKPIERIFKICLTLITEQKELSDAEIVGTIDRIDHPDIIRVKLSDGNRWESGALHIAALPHGEQRYVLALFKQVQGADVIGTGLSITKPHEELRISPLEVVKTHDQDNAQALINGLGGSDKSEIIGFTVENSNISTLRFEVAMDQYLSEGDVIYARINAENVYYQIVDAITSEESFDQNPHGKHIVNATQLGTYDAKEGFLKYKWLPKMNSPLFSTRSFEFEKPIISQEGREFPIGKVPSTGVEVLANIDDIIELHTAVLGVTGTGKTEVALFIIKEALHRDAKVICVDLTGEYKLRLKDYNPVLLGPSFEKSQEFEGKLVDVELGKFGAKEEKAALETYLSGFKGKIKEQTVSFLEGNDSNLAILELADIANTKGTLRTTEMYLSAAMNWAKENRKKKKIMIALEEAHTIIPEPMGAAVDYATQQVVARIGQIALQGRKYGVGLLVISQRTALVSKTILSQCNTFLTHSLIDQTSLSFLESTYSSQHTKLIPNLPKYHFLAFGKAIKSERPIVLEREFDPKIAAEVQALNADVVKKAS